MASQGSHACHRLNATPTNGFETSKTEFYSCGLTLKPPKVSAYQTEMLVGMSCVAICDMFSIVPQKVTAILNGDLGEVSSLCTL